MEIVIAETVIAIVIIAQFGHAFLVLRAQKDAVQDVRNVGAVEVVEIVKVAFAKDVMDVENVNVDNFAQNFVQVAAKIVEIAALAFVVV